MELDEDGNPTPQEMDQIGKQATLSALKQGFKQAGYVCAYNERTKESVKCYTWEQYVEVLFDKSPARFKTFRLKDG